MAGTYEVAEGPSQSSSPDAKSKIGRFLSSRKSREGSVGHKRGKSRDTLGEKGKDHKHVASRSVVSFSAAFPNSSVKSLPVLGIFYKTIHGTNANPGSSPRLQSKSRTDSFLSSIFKNEKLEDPKTPDTEISSVQTEDAQIQTIKDRMIARGYHLVDEDQVKYALSPAMGNGDTEKAMRTMIQFQNSVDGIITSYDPEITMLGAENRNKVTCWLDSLLFAMFARSSNFEHMIKANYDDDSRRRLSTVLRLWVNMMREGTLINEDITRILQESISTCGWEEAGQIEQQDVCEAFGFLTDKLDLPLLKLKVDLFHTGDDDQDDHRFVEERFLAIAVPDEVQPGQRVRLEDCLDGFFNNRIEVSREALARTNTRSSNQSSYSSSDEKSATAQHIEEREIPGPDEDSSSTGPSTPTTHVEVRQVDGSNGREDAEQENDRNNVKSSSKGSKAPRQIPAWQFFNLIPWTTRTTHSEGEASMEEHLLETLPQLAICLKRYGVKDGRPFRKNTLIDIPLEFRIPHFADDPLVPHDARDKFKLVLQSVVCHRGNSLQSGHYVGMFRGEIPPPDGDSGSTRELNNDNQPPDYAEERWYKHDDLANPRVFSVDIHEELDREMPYLLFYQIQSTDEVPGPAVRVPQNEPPTYTASAEQSTVHLIPERHTTPPQGYFDDASQYAIPPNQDPTPTIRFSTELDRSPSFPGQSSIISSEERRGSIVFSDDRRGSLAFTDTSLGSTASSILPVSAPVTPSEETTGQRMSRAASRFAKSGSSKSRPQSQSGETKMGGALSRLNFTRSRDNLRMMDVPSKDSKDPSPRKGSIIATPRESSPRKTSVIATPRASITIEELERPSEHSLRSLEHTTTQRSKSRLGRKRDKSKGPSDKSDLESHHHHHRPHHSLSHKLNKSKDDNDRECGVM